MTRRSGLLQALVQAQREAQRRQAAQLRSLEQVQRRQITQLRSLEKKQEKSKKDAEKAQKDYERARIANQKEQEKLYAQSRIAQVQWQNAQLDQQVSLFEHLLKSALSTDPYIDLQTLKQAPNLPPFNPGPLAIAVAPPQPYRPPEQNSLQKFLPGAKEKYAQEVVQAQDMYRAQMAAYMARENARQQALVQMKAKYEQQIIEERRRVAQQHAEIDEFQKSLLSGSPESIVDYFSMVLASSSYPDNFPQHPKLAYVPESRQLVVEYDLPPFELIPEIASYKYVKSKDSVTTTARPLAQRKALYVSAIAQITLRTLYELFKADRLKQLDTVAFNGYTSSVNKGTGHAIRTCLITVRTSRDVFTGLNLSQVDPQVCLATLNASISKSPAELIPVRPVMDFNMVDPRFIEEIDVLSGLDQRPNLMELTPSEFESLITNLFQKMGLEARQTQASRDGGVDCVAFDPRPIFGGKVVIQAKRYKHTVGVSAVRDLYGTVQNEGASKGILVTTSGYGKASFEFAEGKPLELLSGSNLLYLLKEYASLDAKIQMPESWQDPQPDREEG
ncbi:restriction endonuclease [Ktedonosporobacter rubrisoli]|uniref:Restriction endonuclease n=1 Tax=Ktedonosporobacter rubrisoli TaxID=2509675 RepID=A0A4P6K3R9_KTERU|nr:restriction endonuclease [Ktedonosporobacter rubrisoli]QBD82563.1 restriction endonuclease [Ktedonosporobacter rubrisoli]